MHHYTDIVTINSDDIANLRMFLGVYKQSNLFLESEKDKFDDLSKKLVKLNVALFADSVVEVAIKDNVILIKC